MALKLPRLLHVRQWSLRQRVMFLGLAPALFMLVLLLGYFLQARLTDAERELSASGHLMARQLAASADYAVISGNADSLRGQLDALLRQPGVVRVRIYAADEQLVIEHGHSRDMRSDLPEHRLRHFTAPIESVVVANAEDWLTPVASAVPSLLGRVEITFRNELALAREREILFTGLLLGGLALVVTFLLANAMASQVRRPLEAVIGMVDKLEARDFRARVDVGTDGEIGTLGDHLNLLARTLDDARRLQARYTQELVDARAHADRASRAKSDFLAMMSHELRTPLNGVSGMLQLLEDTTLDVEQKEYVRHAGQAGTDLLRMVDDILDFSRLEQGRLLFEHKPFDAPALLRTLVDEFRVEAGRRQLTLDFELESRPDEHILIGDPLRLRQILTKLLDNAVKFTPSGRITVRLLTAARPGQQVMLTCEVCDTGIGIDAQRLAQIFEPFVQVDNRSSRRYGGAGLGLAIARRLTELMGGNLSVDSEPDVGSCFVFEVMLPIEQAELMVQQADGPFHARVFVVEDNPANQLVAEGMLRQMGCEVVVLPDGEAALEMLALEEDRVDLLFMDCQLPGIDGFETTRRWRAMESGRRLPIIALTAHAQDSVAEACLKAGMDAVLTKPFRRQELADALAAWLAGPGANAGDGNDEPPPPS
ncbi:MAG: ATP-binding protein [Moraxellaceae bacterium]|nr:ATP-binding protein [Moraxellaceae bacterium]